jgi:hypothetical protein
MKTHPKARLGLAGRHALVAMIGGGQSMRAAARAFNGDVTRRCAGARVHTQTTQGRDGDDRSDGSPIAAPHRDGDLRTARPARRPHRATPT